MVNIATPALLFPAISLLILAYTNRFLALAALVRNLHAAYIQNKNPKILNQIENLKKRLVLVRNMQALGITSMLSCVISMFLFLVNYEIQALYIFGASLVMLALSLILSLAEILISIKALSLQISDMESE